MRIKSSSDLSVIFALRSCCVVARLMSAPKWQILRGHNVIMPILSVLAPDQLYGGGQEEEGSEEEEVKQAPLYLLRSPFSFIELSKVESRGGRQIRPEKLPLGFPGVFPSTVPGKDPPIPHPHLQDHLPPSPRPRGPSQCTNVLLSHCSESCQLFFRRKGDSHVKRREKGGIKIPNLVRMKAVKEVRERDLDIKCFLY